MDHPKLEVIARTLYNFGGIPISDSEWTLLMAHYKAGSKWLGEPHRYSPSDALFDKARAIIKAYES